MYTDSLHDFALDEDWWEDLEAESRFKAVLIWPLIHIMYSSTFMTELAYRCS